MSNLEKFTEACLKHLQGQHNQRRHGYRYGGVSAARRSMRGMNDPAERAEYRRRAGMPKPKKIEKVRTDVDLMNKEHTLPGFHQGVLQSQRTGKFYTSPGTYARRLEVFTDNWDSGIKPVIGAHAGSLPTRYQKKDTLAAKAKLDRASKVGDNWGKDVARQEYEKLLRRDTERAIFGAKKGESFFD